MLKKIAIIGAGQIGSRHLQALSNVKQALDILVVDPSQDSLATARQRYESMPNNNCHQIRYLNSLPFDSLNFDVAIIATSSDARRQAVESILSQASVRYLLLEKLLFQKKADYDIVGRLFKKTKTKVWVNCMMRSIPFYKELKREIKDKKIFCLVNRSDTGLATSTIHYLDYLAFLTDCLQFNVEVSNIDKKVIMSKRKGFFELTGSVDIKFKNGGRLIFNQTATGEVLPEIIIYNSDLHCIVRETEEKAWISFRKEGWKWKEVPAVMPFQSSMTTHLIEELILKGNCPLVEYEDAVKLHLPLLDAYLKFFNKYSSKKLNYYPFT